jgi:hypothetical protein
MLPESPLSTLAVRGPSVRVSDPRPVSVRHASPGAPEGFLRPLAAFLELVRFPEWGAPGEGVERKCSPDLPVPVDFPESLSWPLRFEAPASRCFLVSLAFILLRVIVVNFRYKVKSFSAKLSG